MWTSLSRSGGGLSGRRTGDLRPVRPLWVGGGFSGLTQFFALFAVLTLLGAGAARAQTTPPDSMTIVVRVTTDRQVYRVSDPVQVTISVANISDRPQNLDFTSGCMVNYTIDDTAFDWLSRAACPAVVSQLHLPPGFVHVFPAFIHLPSDYFLTPGTHVITGEVIGYGSSVVPIVVTQGDDEPPPSPLLLFANVAPQVVELGGTVQFGVTVANLTREVQEVHFPDGCGARLTVDGWWQSTRPCTQAPVTLTLQPGERLYLAGPGLLFDTSVLIGRADAIGVHSGEIWVGDAGTTAIRFHVTDPSGGNTEGGIEGTVSREDGSPAIGAMIYAMSWNAPTDSFPPPPSDSTRGPDGGGATPPRQIYGPATTDSEGRYRLTGLPADDYLAWVLSPDGTILWYDGARAPDMATPISVAAGETTKGIDFRLGPYVPPPPLFPGIIEGTILNWIPEGSEQPQYPIAGAVVVALLESTFAYGDTVPPGDDDDGDDDDPTRGGNGTLPPIPPDGGWWVPRFYGLTDAEGRFRIEVPYGTYRLVAGESSRRYQWWPNADRIDGAQELPVLPEGPPVSANFALKALDPANSKATVSGRVLASTLLPPPGGDPTTGDSTLTGGGGSDGTPRDGTPPDDAVRPIEGAQVVAHLLIEDPRLMVPTQIVVTHTDGDGRYTLELSPTSPILVQAFAEGYYGQFYNHVSDIWNATPVDVTSDKPTDGIDFDLQQQALPPDWGNLGGRVTTPDATTVDANGDIVERPLAGAIVRIRAANPGFGPFEMVTRTDGQGWWFAAGLPYLPDGSITYIVSAEAEGFVPTYHPSAHRASQATPVSPLPPYVDAISMVDVSMAPQPTDGPYFIAGHVRGSYSFGTVPPGGGGGGTDDGRPGGDGTGRGPFGGAPGDSLPPDPDGTAPLVGAFVYLVRIDPADRHEVVAGAVACDNGTYLLTGLPEGSYLVYADRPGFRSEWFGGDAPNDAAVIRLGPASPSALLEFTLEVLDGDTPPRDDDGGGGDGEAGFNVPMTDLRSAPNPSRPQTTIMYRLRTMAEVTVRVYDINGRLIRTLFDRSLQNAGEQRVGWDGRDENGETVGAGMYFFRVETARQWATGKMVVVR